MRTCTKCNQTYPTLYFNRDKSRRDGVYPQCKNCTRENCRRVYQNDHARRLEKNRAWKRENADRHRAINREWQKNNLDSLRANTANYRRRKKLATPAWVDAQEMARIHDNCPQGHHVDHVHPLVGENFCGLNVPWNLQYLPAAEHMKKGCKPPVEAGGHYNL